MTAINEIDVTLKFLDKMSNTEADCLSQIIISAFSETKNRVKLTTAEKVPNK